MMEEERRGQPRTIENEKEGGGERGSRVENADGKERE